MLRLVFLSFTADSVADHKLKWEMFRFQELECFDGMLNRLYKQELGTIVGKYEKYRRAVDLEIDKRVKMRMMMSRQVN